MPSPRRHLLLPSEKGLVHYDLLEETAFVGLGPRGTIVAAPTPFPSARIALSDDGRGFVARALPGEPPPEVNGAPGEGVRLADGARIRVGDRIALFRSPDPAPIGVAESGAASLRPARARAGGAAIRTATSTSASRAGTALALGGVFLVLGAAYQAVRYLESKGAQPVPPVTQSMLSSPSHVRSTPEEQAHVELERLLVADTGDVTTMQDVFDGYVSLAKSSPQTMAGEHAALRVAELRIRLADVVWKSTAKDVESALRTSRYRTAIGHLEGFEARFGGTEAARAMPDRIASVRRDARMALDALAARVAPMLPKEATRAYRLLTTSNLELPADLSEELASWMAQVRGGWGPKSPPPPTKDPTPATGPTPAAPPDPAPVVPQGPPDPTATGPGGAFGGRPKQKETPNPGATPPPPPLSGADRSVAARALWIDARAHLTAQRFAEAKDAYGRLKKDFADTAAVLAHPERVKAGYMAADVGVRGPVAFLRQEATMKNGRLECEWSFDDDRAFLDDFTVEQAFEGLEPVECEIRSGMAILSGSTAMLCTVVFDPSDVTWEADCVADVHRDYGLFALQQSKDWRSLALAVGSTQFKLKKGAAAKVLAGHILWLFGDGVWKDADKGEKGFVRLAEQLGSSLKPSERLRVELEVRGDRVEGSIHSKNDPAHLKGPLKGDDGKGMTALRVGAFAYKGRVGVERLKVSGKVDESWALEAFQKLVAAETGPD